MRARIVRRMAKPDKPPSVAPLIDVNNPDQMIRLALAGVFTLAEILRAARPNMTMLQVADHALLAADRLIDAVSRARDA